ncbi:MAG TPA: sensor domain-containing diguanylate cyclase, partial [Candidatus Angelobacter sp.]|nr:sensor domain-containing diguanylate cyclase [Candidatus Angelobacter sp.]
MSNRSPNPRRLFLAALLFVVATILSAKLGTLLSVSQSTYVSFWLPAGLYLGVLLVNETRDWPWFVLAAITA